MEAQGHRYNRVSFRLLAITVAAIAVFMTPVEYRAGASVPHPHAMLQLIYEASRGIPAHHHAVSYDSQQERTRSNVGVAAHDPRAPHIGPDHSGHRVDVAQQADVSLAVVVKLFTALMPAITLVPPSLVSRIVGVRSGVLLRGLALTPEPPPPRV